MLYLSLAMTRHPAKIFLATFVTAMLLYYNAAGAILRCCHVDDHSSLEEMLPSSPAPSEIDCLSLDYRSEVLASPPSAPQFHRGTAERTVYVNDLLVPKGVIGVSWKTPGGNILARGSPNAEPSIGPPYLSCLRI